MLSCPERISELERAVAEAKLLEEQDAKLAACNLMPARSLLKVTAGRLQQEPQRPIVGGALRLLERTRL